MDSLLHSLVRSVWNLTKTFYATKKYRAITDLEDLIVALNQSISRKTSELRNRNNELKKKQTEALKQNKELSEAYKALTQSRERYNKLVSSLEEEYFLYGMNLNDEVEYVSQSVEKSWDIPSRSLSSNARKFLPKTQ